MRATLTGVNVSLRRVSDSAVVPATLNTSGGGDVIVLQPNAALANQTQYRFTVSDGLEDLSGEAFIPFTSTFTTGNRRPAADPPTPSSTRSRSAPPPADSISPASPSAPTASSTPPP